MAPPRLPFTKGLKTLLITVTGKPFFIARLPRDQAAIPKPPYGIIYPLNAGRLTGPDSDTDADATFIYQVSSVGLDATGAEWLSDKVRGGVLDRDPETGDYVHAWPLPENLPWKVMSGAARRSQAGAGAAVPSEGMVTIAEQFAVSVTPA